MSRNSLTLCLLFCAVMFCWCVSANRPEFMPSVYFYDLFTSTTLHVYIHITFFLVLWSCKSCLFLPLNFLFFFAFIGQCDSEEADRKLGVGGGINRILLFSKYVLLYKIHNPDHCTSYFHIFTCSLYLSQQSYMQRSIFYKITYRETKFIHSDRQDMICFIISASFIII